MDLAGSGHEVADSQRTGSSPRRESVCSLSELSKLADRQIGSETITDAGRARMIQPIVLQAKGDA